MTVRRLRALSSRDVAGLPDTCSCGGRRLLTDTSAWADAAVERFGLCGVVAHDADQPIAWLLVCPALNLPARHPLAVGARSSQDAQLLQVHVDEAWRGIGLGRQLVQCASARLSGSVQGIDALGSPGTGSCLAPPLPWLAGVGFTPDGPAAADGRRRAHLDLSRTVRWTPDLRAAANRLLGWAAPASSPQTTRIARGE